MKIRIEYFSWWPQIAAIILGIFVSEIAHDAETTYLGYSAIVLIVIINAMESHTVRIAWTKDYLYKKSPITKGRLFFGKP